MKNGYFTYTVILVSLVLGWIFWIVESAVEALFFYDATFMELAFTNVPEHEIYLRSVVMSFFMISSLIMLRLMSKRRKAEQALEEEKEKLSVTIRSIGDGVITTDTEGCVTMMNNKAEDLTGWPLREARGRAFREVFRITSEKTGKTAADPVTGVLESRSIIGLGSDIILTSLKGNDYIISDTAAPIRDSRGGIIGVVVVFSDITAKRKRNEQINKSEKLKAIGILAGGIAHDFNNILTAGMGNISLAQRKADREGLQEITEPLLDAHESLQHARDLTGQLLTFSKGGNPVKKETDTAPFIEEVIEASASVSGIRFERSIPGHAEPLLIDRGQAAQALRNIIQNAVQAMPEGGTIHISAENVTGGAGCNIPLQKGRYVSIHIKDEGIGIPREYVSRIFDPYFTTKQEGNGLGLATAYSIVRKHGGMIDVSSESAEGTCVSVYLPAYTGDGRSEEGPTEVVEKYQQEGGKILLMDDEEFVRKVGERILSELGFEIETAEDGEKALDMYAKALEKKTPYNAVIMDLTIPGGIGGKETMEKLMELHAGVKGIVSSGYSTDPVMAEYKKYGFSGCIQKPYEIDELKSVLNEVLG